MKHSKFKKGDIVRFIEDYGPIDKGYVFQVDKVVPYISNGNTISYIVKNFSEGIAAWEFRLELNEKYKTKIADIL